MAFRPSALQSALSACREGRFLLCERSLVPVNVSMFSFLRAALELQDASCRRSQTQLLQQVVDRVSVKLLYDGIRVRAEGCIVKKQIYKDDAGSQQEKINDKADRSEHYGLSGAMRERFLFSLRDNCEDDGDAAENDRDKNREKDCCSDGENTD